MGWDGVLFWRWFLVSVKLVVFRFICTGGFWKSIGFFGNEKRGILGNRAWQRLGKSLHEGITSFSCSRDCMGLSLFSTNMTCSYGHTTATFIAADGVECRHSMLADRSNSKDAIH